MTTKFYVLFEGDRACWTNPISRSERISYRFPTASGLRGAIESIYWHPGINWVIDRVWVLNPIEFDFVKKLELKNKISYSKIEKEILNNMVGSIRINPKPGNSSSTLRTTMYLTNVKYLVEFHYEKQYDSRIGLDDKSLYRKSIKVMAHFLDKGKCYKTPYLGLREFSCKFTRIKEDELESIKSYYLGQSQESEMLFDGFGYDRFNQFIVTKKFLCKVKMIDGIIDYEKLRKDYLVKASWINNIKEISNVSSNDE